MGATEHDDRRRISAISAQGIAYLATRGRIDLGRPARRWIGQALRAHSIEAEPVTVEIAGRAGELDPTGFPGDAVDRIIYATALECGMRLVTADRRIGAFDPTRCVL